MEGCRQRCIYCRQEAAQEEIVTSATQIATLLKESLAYKPAGKTCEAAFFGGSFTALPIERRKELYSVTRPYLDSGEIDYLRVSTRPDLIDEKIVEELVSNGVKIVELGIQSLDENVLELARRDHDSKCPYTSTKLLQEAGIQTGWQLMQGLPGSSRQSDLDSLKRTLNAGPDFLRLFPTVVLDETPLADMWRKEEYKPLELEDAVERLAEMMELCDENGMTVIRLGLHPSPSLRKIVLAGPFHPAMRHKVESLRRLKRLEDLLAKNKISGKRSPTFKIKSGSQSLWRGLNNSNTKDICERFNLENVSFEESPDIGTLDIKIKI